MESRSKKSIRNIVTGLANKFILMILAFSTQTIFIRLLGAEYNGVKGLYSNILTVLSLADLGMLNVLTYSLYKALKNGDKSEIALLVAEFKKIYRIIALVVILTGLLLVPFLPFVVNSSLPMEEVIIYYLLYLTNSAASYFVVYKTTVITADQNGYISNICSTVSSVLMYVLQIVYLLLTRNFLGYLVIQVMCTIGNNVVLNFIANKRYPYLNDKSLIASGKVDKGLILENLKSTFVYKICVVMINNTDNILISIILGTVYVGYYSNYYTLTQYIISFIAILTTGLTASLGNLNAENNADKSFKTFNMMGLIYAVIACVCVNCFAGCIQQFVPFWIGEEYLLDNFTVGCILLVFYISTIITPVYTFRETMGLFKEVKWIMVAAMLVNIVGSIILGKIMGLAGIILATALAQLGTKYWYEPRILFKKKFHQKVQKYFKRQALYVIGTVVSLIISMSININLPSTILFLPVRIAVSGLVSLFVMLALSFKTPEFQDCKSYLVQIKKK